MVGKIIGRSLLALSLVGLLTAGGLAQDGAPADPPPDVPTDRPTDPEEIAAKTVEMANKIADRCVDRNEETANRCVEKITQLLEEEKVREAVRVGRRCLQRLRHDTDRCLHAIQHICRRGVHAIQANGGSDELVESVKNECQDAAERARNSAIDASEEIKGLLPDPPNGGGGNSDNGAGNGAGV